MIFLSLWLVGWLFGEVTVLVAIVAMCFGFKAGNPLQNAGGLAFVNAGSLAFMIVWITFWTNAGGFVMDALIWQLQGRETIRIDPHGQDLVICRVGTLLPRRTRVFPLEEVRNLRYTPLNIGAMFFPVSFRESLEAQGQWFGTAGGSIGFDHDSRTDRFGSQLSETESRRLIRTIKDRYQIPDEKDEPLPIERL